jgi:hypothetical protein
LLDARASLDFNRRRTKKLSSTRVAWQGSRSDMRWPPAGHKHSLRFAVGAEAEKSLGLRPQTNARSSQLNRRHPLPTSRIFSGSWRARIVSIISAKFIPDGSGSSSLRPLASRYNATSLVGSLARTPQS